ncbi:ATP-dependent nuclease [Aeromonas hydrophila]|uniref:ATP-dependent nuclease n=1 Tax=Aeromonas hydrophila TaxID=644 RepID=UPI0038D04BDA
MIIDRLKIKNGDYVRIGKFTILIGPNNVGKSQTLKDIHNKFVKPDGMSTTILESVEFDETPSLDFFLTGLDVKPHQHHVGMEEAYGIASKLNQSESIAFQRSHLEQQYAQKGVSALFGNLAKFRISYLDAESRLSIAKTSPSANLHKVSPQNLLQALYGASSDVEKQLREAFNYVFGKDIKLDYSGLTELVFRISDKFENVPEDPKVATNYFDRHAILDDQGDGFRSFVGVVLSLLLSHERIVLLDEPEAFLHPAQSRQLGYWMAKHIERVPGQVIISTHNSNFIAGILTANHPVDIYRLNRYENKTTFNRIPPESTELLAKSPILSSQRVLDSLFHKGVVVCEADSDRIIYSTVANVDLSIQDVLFIHAHNKQTVHIVLELLTKANVPCCGIVDIDVLNGVDDLNNILSSLGHKHINAVQQNIIKDLASEIESGSDSLVLGAIKKSIEEFLNQLNNNEHTFSGARGAINRIRKDASKWSTVKTNGVNLLNNDLRARVDTFLVELSNCGVFVVPVGELEGWINLGDVKKNKWIVPALEFLAKNGSPQPLTKFIKDVVDYLNGLSQDAAI